MATVGKVLRSFWWLISPYLTIYRIRLRGREPRDVDVSLTLCSVLDYAKNKAVASDAHVALISTIKRWNSKQKKRWFGKQTGHRGRTDETSSVLIPCCRHGWWKGAHPTTLKYGRPREKGHARIKWRKSLVFSVMVADNPKSQIERADWARGMWMFRWLLFLLA